MYIEDRSKDTMSGYVYDMGVWFLEGQGRVAASEQGPLQAQRRKEKCKAPGSCPAAR